MNHSHFSISIVLGIDGVPIHAGCISDTIDISDVLMRFYFEPKWPESAHMCLYQIVSVIYALAIYRCYTISANIVF